MNQENLLEKISGELSPLKRESQGFIENLEKKSKIEIEDLLERQNKLLANKSFLSKLPDRGERITKFRDKLVKELIHRNQMEQAANLLSQLNIASEGREAMNQLEWTGKYENKNSTEKIVELDSDDEEDPLKILAQPTGTGTHKKKIITLTPEKTLINEQDLKEIESFKTEDHIKYIVEKVEKDEKPQKEVFKPYKTTKSNVHDPMKEKVRKKDKYWEVTAATPPLIVHGAVKTLSLNESLKLQKEQSEKLHEIQAKHAIERLTQLVGKHNIDVVPSGGLYRAERTRSDSSGSEHDEEHEVYDDEDHDKAGTVVFTVDSIHE